ncbi:subtilisin-like proprotein convertase family protein [Saccharothrix tamanrassetensis]|uniref:Subtilisin-like proprotein convertase family protein n=1 Tax=Saccharothrix tamanrassetensis TaxID=1051531 RepID=A0A841CL76_9PSEU|nr:S8 family serine peptidase [Saccharothrix tamanrassetensis]MBB5956745.1 subtilisin-like proprotein convertase family protein [Saccharothrix tamanrassetensis]
MLAAGAAVLLTLLGSVTPASADPTKTSKGVQDRTAAQIAALQDIKKSVTPAESKLDSALVVEERRRSNATTFNKLPALQTGVKVQNGNTVVVDIRAHHVTDELVTAVRNAGGAIRSVSTEGKTVRAQVPLWTLSRLAARRDVRRVETAVEYKSFHQQDRAGRDAKAPSKEDKAKEVEARTLAALTGTKAAAPKVGEGDRAHAADTARQTHRVTGTGVKLCALSNGVASLGASQAAGELPAVEILPSQEGSGDEGTALLEILHDIAPNAGLGFATAVNGDAGFADNIRGLRFQLGCDVIVDDILYLNESPFQDGVIARAVDAVVADGAVFFSSAGNEGNVAEGTSGHWEGDFVDSGVGIGKFAGTAHDFDPDPGAKQVFNPLSDSSGNVPVTLFWFDPLASSFNDYDLYAANAQGNVVAFSQNNQDGTQDPYERLNTPAGGLGLRLAVVKFRGEDKYISLSALGGRFKDSSDGLKKFSTPGVTRGHSAAKGAISVAAAPANNPLPYDLEPGDPANPRGPYPNAFDRTQKPERFTSDGPRRVFFAPDGTPSPEVRQKPDLTAADGVQTSVTGFNPFFGTSASAPNAAAIAGLILSGNPTLTPAEVREALTTTALDIAETGVDNRTGAGIVRADLVLAHTGASPQPLARAQKPSVVNDSDGSQYLKPGTTATVTVPVLNTGDGLAASTSLVLTSATAGVTIAPRSKYYGNVEVGQTVTNTFKVTVPASAPVGQPVRLDARVTYAGTLSPTTSTFQIPVGEPSREAKHFAYGGPVVAIPDNDTVGIAVPIEVSGVGRGSKITFSIDGATCSAADGATTVGIDHTFVGDLVGTLTSPSGATATLFQRVGGTGANLCQVVFDDSADRPFSSVTSAKAPFTGGWRPIGSLNALLTEPVDGTWTFKVVDSVVSDRGSIRAVSLHINGYI